MNELGIVAGDLPESSIAECRLAAVDVLLRVAQSYLQVARDSGDPESGFQGAVLADAATILLREAALEEGITPP